MSRKVIPRRWDWIGPLLLIAIFLTLAVWKLIEVLIWLARKVGM